MATGPGIVKNIDRDWTAAPGYDDSRWPAVARVHTCDDGFHRPPRSQQDRHPRLPIVVGGKRGGGYQA